MNYGEITMRILIAIALLSTLSACNTIAGVGEDITGSATWIKEKIFGKPVDLGPSASDGQAESVKAKPVTSN